MAKDLGEHKLADSAKECAKKAASDFVSGMCTHMTLYIICIIIETVPRHCNNHLHVHVYNIHSVILVMWVIMLAPWNIGTLLTDLFFDTCTFISHKNFSQCGIPVDNFLTITIIQMCSR